MSLWGNLDASNNAPLFSGLSGYKTTVNVANAQIDAVFNNVTINSTEANVALGVFAVDTTEIADVSSENHSGAHAGWIARRAFTGPVLSITGDGVTSNGYITFIGGSPGAAAGQTGNTAANAQVYVNSAGWLVNVTIMSAGSYANTPNVVFPSGNVSPTVTMGGRANRVQLETLVAMGSMTGDSGGQPFP